MKRILFKILSVVSPFLILAILGVLQGAWFDVEEFIERGDAETYRPPAIQYLVYYLVSASLLVFFGLLLAHEYKNTSNRFCRVLYAALLLLNICIILACTFTI